MWLKSRTDLWSYVKNGWPNECPLDLETATTYWREYFTKPSTIDEEGIRCLNASVTGVWRPLAAEEIQNALKSQRGKALGVDKVGPDQLLKVPMAILEAFLDTVMWCQSTPKALKKNRTILIPKKSESSSDPADYRPITVSPIIIRVLNSVLSHRLTTKIKLHSSQRGFISADGCLENVAILDWMLRRSVHSNKAFTLLCLDVRKAFDSVSHYSVIRALRCHGLPEAAIQYITDYLTDSWTSIQSRGQLSEPFRITSGVKQGDPLSPLLFNLVMNELLHRIASEPDIGFEFTRGGTKVKCLAFADDLALTTKSEAEMKTLIKICTEFYCKRGMGINGDKSILMLRDIGSRAQSTVLLSDHTIEIEGKKPRVIGKYNDLYQYLGIRFNPSGKLKPNADAVQGMISKLRAAPLKAEQKLYFLRAHLIPSILHEAVLGRVECELLETWDAQIKRFVKDCCHLSFWAIDGLIYLPISKGGLGITNLRYAIPRILLSRLNSLDQTDYNLVLDWLKSPECEKLKLKLKNMLAACVDQKLSMNLDSRENYCKFWFERAKRTADGKGVREYSNVPGVGNNWLTSGSKVLSGKMFIKGVQLRFNALPCGDNAVRHLRGQGLLDSSQPRDPGGRFLELGFTARCRYKCRAQETIAHITQKCKYTQNSMTVDRHDALVRDISRHLSKLGCTVLTERQFRTPQGRRRPDIICSDRTHNRVYILDVTCTFESKNPLDESASDKANYYNIPELYEQVKELLRVPTGEDTVAEAHGLVFGARGGIAQKTYRILKLLGVTKKMLNLWCELTIFRTLMVYQHFQRGNNWHRTRQHPIGSLRARPTRHQRAPPP
jgi:hypothetical protein